VLFEPRKITKGTDYTKRLAKLALKFQIPLYQRISWPSAPQKALVQWDLGFEWGVFWKIGWLDGWKAGWLGIRKSGTKESGTWV
jgi:hypothetical protein